MRRFTTLLCLIFAACLALSACGGCDDDNNGGTNNGGTNNGDTNNGGSGTNRPIAASGQEVVVELPEIDLASAAASGYLPNLEDPIAPEESRELIAGFDWADTEPLPETSPDGRNSMWYVLVYLDSQDSARALRDSGIYHDMLPLFGEERERWAGEVGAFRFRGDGEGIFAFAVLHGRIYNTLRELALEGDPAFRGIVLREPPEGATQSDGSLDYEYLAARGFRYGAPIEMPSEDGPADTITNQQEIVYVPGMPVSILRAQINLGFDAIDELRRAATEVAGFFGGESQFMIEVDVLNSDPAFDGNPEPLMRSAWRRGTGEVDSAPEIELTGAKVRLQTELLLADAPLGSDGITRINAFNDTAYSVCIAARNGAAEVSEFLTPIIACHFAPPAVDAMGNPVDNSGAVQSVDAETLYHRVIVKDYALNILAQFTDSRNFMRHSVGFEPRAAHVLTGPFADLIGEVQGEPRAFAVCNGHGVLPFDAVLALVEPARIALNNDVLFPGVGDRFIPGGSNAAVSRGVPTHEYGHFAMCQLLERENFHAFTTLWTDVALRSLGGQLVEYDNLWTVEGWADFFAFQVVGGTNYFSFAGWMGTNATNVYYCNPLRTPPSGSDMHPACLEENVGGAAPTSVVAGAFATLGATVASVLHDAFDGPGIHSGELPRYPAATDGAWTNFGANGVRFRAGRGSANDEDVSLPPEAIRSIFHHFVWAPNVIITGGGFYDAIARTLTDYGFESDDICAMFALHDPAGDCFNLISEGALDTTDSTPSSPFNLRGRLLAGNDADFTWEDGSYFATGWEWELVGGGETRSGSIPFTQIPVHIERGLLPNTEYNFTIHTVNGSNRSLRDASVRLTTLAEAPTITATQGLPGAISATWTSSASTEYIVEVELPGGEIREMGRTTATTFQVNGLDGDAVHRVRVYAVNRTGIASAPSAWESVRTAAVTTVYVTTTGSDAAAGGATTPVATLGRALQIADATSAQVIEVAAGQYLQPTPLVVDFPVTIRGTARSQILVQSLRAGFSSSGSCGAANFATRPTFAAVYVAPGASLYLDDVAIYAAEEVDRTACIAAIDSDGSELRLTNAEVGVRDGATSDVPCAVGVLARNMANVSFHDSEVYGFREVGPIGAATVDAAAVCLGGNTSAVQMIDSHFEPFGDGFTSAAVASLYGVIVNANTVRISRSRFFAQGRDDDATVGAAFVAGLWARVQNTLSVDNSVFLTPGGGTTNDAIRVASVATPILLSLVHVTATVGNDWGNASMVAAGHDAAALRIVGAVDHFELVNSLLNHAGGFSPTGVTAAVNLEETDTLCDLSIRGNALAIPDRPFGNGKGGLIVHDSDALEFGIIVRGINARGSWSSDACATGSGVELNLEMYEPPGSVNSARAVPAVDAFGYPVVHTSGANTYTGPRDALFFGGLPLDSSGLAAYSVIGTDVVGNSRPMSGAPTIGAYTHR